VFLDRHVVRLTLNVSVTFMAAAPLNAGPAQARNEALREISGALLSQICKMWERPPNGL
jgi:hypothetical protein